MSLFPLSLTKMVHRPLWRPASFRKPSQSTKPQSQLRALLAPSHDTIYGPTDITRQQGSGCPHPGFSHGALFQAYHIAGIQKNAMTSYGPKRFYKGKNEGEGNGGGDWLCSLTASLHALKPVPNPWGTCRTSWATLGVSPTLRRSSHRNTACPP